MLLKRLNNEFQSAARRYEEYENVISIVPSKGYTDSDIPT
jgi:hypothetical protein